MSSFLWSLFVSSFISSTLMPGGSEALVVYGMKEFAENFWLIVLIATTGNTLGAMVTYLIGRIFPNKVKPEILDRFKKWGSLSLLFSWLPIIGDGFCLAAGWLRIPVIRSFFLIATGKFARYLVLASAFVKIWNS